MNKPIDEKWLHSHLWLRVVDGELDRAELAELVAACEQQPELWKRCAVAFLEEQTLQLELRELAESWPASPSEMLAPERPVLVQAQPRRAQPLAAAHSPWLNHVVFAASVVLAFLVGWQASLRFGGAFEMRNKQRPEQTSVAGNFSPAEGTSPAAVTSRLAGPREREGRNEPMLAGTTRVDAATAAMQATAADTIELALEQAEQFVPLDRRIPEPLANLQQRGLVQIESIEGFVPVRLRDGETAVVPVQQIDLRPVRRAY
jgi:hypothetical protein